MFLIKGSNALTWTSATNEGLLSEQNHQFCSTDAAVSKAFWITGQPSNPWKNRCVALQMNSQNSAANGLVDADCATILQGTICKGI
jgi:hypothetical protein